MTTLRHVSAVLLIGWLCHYLINAIFSRRRMKGAKSPPGPIGVPLLGSHLELSKGPHLSSTFNKWAEEYGPIFQFKALGQKHVVLSSEKAANDLLVKLGNIYSDRETAPAVKVLTQGLFVPLRNRSESWRRQRKLIHDVISAAADSKLEPLMELESRYTLLDLLETPEHFDKHFGRYSFGVLTRSTFGFKTKSVDDPFIQEVKDQNSFAHNAFRSDLYISNLAPWVLKLPSWLVSDNVVLLAAFSRMAGFIKTLQDNVKAEISQGKAFDSFQRYFLENQHEYGLSELEGGVVFQVFMFAGTRLPHNVLLEFVLAMMQSLEWQEKMQKEVDSVVGPNRLPEFSDISNLPTVRAVLKESMRSRTIVGESSVPHKLSQDDFYNGYFFEKGTIVHANFSAILQERTIYPDGREFNPARWLEPEYPTYKEPLTVYPNLQGFTSFGHGRRACPGAHFTERSLTIMVARIAWGATIKRRIDPSTKKEYPLGIRHKPDDIAKVLQATADIVPRSREKFDLVRKAVQEGLNSDTL